MEIVEGTYGRTVENKLSRICKSNLAKDYINLCHITNNSLTLLKKISYSELKNKNKNYLEANQSFISDMKAFNYGTWIQKPKEVNSFELTIEENNPSEIVNTNDKL